MCATRLLRTTIAQEPCFSRISPGEWSGLRTRLSYRFLFRDHKRDRLVGGQRTVPVGTSCTSKARCATISQSVRRTPSPVMLRQIGNILAARAKISWPASGVRSCSQSSPCSSMLSPELSDMALKALSIRQSRPRRRPILSWVGHAASGGCASQFGRSVDPNGSQSKDLNKFQRIPTSMREVAALTDRPLTEANSCV
jgi:hypothetical protein